MEEVVYLQELWQKRAAVAKECGEELGRLNHRTRKVLTRNYFGYGCQEGEAVFIQLVSLINGAAESLSRLAGEAERLSKSAATASVELETADRVGGGPLE